MAININDRAPALIRPYRKGDDVREARRLNQHIDATNRLLRGIKPAIEIEGDAGRKIAETRQMQIQIFEPDESNPDVGLMGWILCIVGLTTYRVAVPPVFRYPDWNGQTINGITYTADPTNWQRRTAVRVSDSQQEIQVITPAYSTFLGGLDTIFAISGIKGDTGVTYPVEDPAPQEGDSDADVEKDAPVVWQDLNVNGRVWAEEFA